MARSQVVGFETFLSGANTFSSSTSTQSSTPAVDPASSALELLKGSGVVRLTTLAEDLKLSPADAMVVVKRLQDQDLVRIDGSETSLESAQIELTDFASEALSVFRMK